MSKSSPNCYQCTHFYVTWDKKFPYGCKAFKMKSRQIPSRQVLVSSGSDCMMFAPKKQSNINNSKNTK